MYLDKTIVLILVFLNYCSFDQCEGVAAKVDELSMMAKLRKDLLENRNYDKMARPVIESSKTVIVNIKYVSVISLDLDINTGALSTNLNMFMSWNDEHLTWNQSDYQGLEQILMDTNDVWMPTLQAWNSIYTASHFGDLRIGNNHPFVRLYSNGTILFEPKPFITTKCQVDVDMSSYPKDEQNCIILLGSFLEQVPELNITAGKEVYCKIPSSVYECKMRETKVYNKDTYPPFLRISIDLKRKTSVYYYLFDLPFYSSIILTLSAFFIPLANNSIYFKLKLTTLSFGLFIMFFTFSLMFTEIGFQSIKTPYIIKCVSFIFTFNCLFLTLTCIMNQNIQSAIKSPPSFLYPLQRMPFLSSSATTSTSQAFASFEVKHKSQRFSNEWINLSTVFDRIFLIVFICLLAIYHPF